MILSQATMYPVVFHRFFSVNDISYQDHGGQGSSMTRVNLVEGLIKEQNWPWS